MHHRPTDDAADAYSARHHAALKTQVAKAYEKVADQLTVRATWPWVDESLIMSQNLILRIVLVAEAEEGAETKTFPRAFVIDGDDYTVVAGERDLSR